MMSEGGMEERQGLGQYVRSQARYGYGTAATSNTATRKSPNPSDGTKFIKHMVSSTDTLMGIALKYNVTVEEIKRVNKLWTNDSLFLREHLLVPLTRNNEHDVSHDLIVVTSDRERSTSNPAQTESSDSQHSEHQGALSGMDFLKKYDSTIAQLKSSVEKMEKNASDLPSVPNVKQTLGFVYELPSDKDTEC
ncbi:lysM and putative peptidoglycan-binding domain-containing protein 1-like isoform X2 [Gigantopelta aegis]|uniref:lysM and putative peptidoglycan-binding domain-containing protein 1-like isoform X2 n=1 Tax=Gigantopelta aegis TaxID=1735272 RepID=UPI001B88D368|nr:lysM and putative peptidoglycan-binding domain-containing protein 1-like isoform X2 [Gigantopelta aegis]